MASTLIPIDHPKLWIKPDVGFENNLNIKGMGLGVQKTQNGVLLFEIFVFIGKVHKWLTH